MFCSSSEKHLKKESGVSQGVLGLKDTWVELVEPSLEKTREREADTDKH